MKKDTSEKFMWGFFFGFGLFFVIVGLMVGITIGIGAGEAMFALMFTPIFSGVGLIFALVGAIPLAKIRKREKLEKWLIANGRTIWGKVSYVEENRSVTVNGRHPYYIYVEYEDEGIVTTLYKFKSAPVWFNVRNIEPGSEIRVYVDKQDMSKHVVDVNSVRSKDDRLAGNVVDFT